MEQEDYLILSGRNFREKLLRFILKYCQFNLSRYSVTRLRLAWSVFRVQACGHHCYRSLGFHC